MDQWIFGKAPINIFKNLKDIIRKISAVIKSLIEALNKFG
jgi:hypothetical protein